MRDVVYMKILIVNPIFPTYGGAERLIVKLANYLTERHHQVTLLTSTITSEIQQEFTDTRIIQSENMNAMASILQNIIYNYDIVNVHNDPAQMMIYPRQRNVVWMCNEPPIEAMNGGTLNEVQRLVVQKHITRVVVSDEFNRKRFKELYDVEPTVIPYGIDTSYFTQNYDKQRAIDKWGLSPTFNLLQVGMHVFTKNQLKTISIFRKLKKRIPDAKLVLAGYNETKYFTQVKQAIANSGLRRDIIVTGAISHEELRDLYHACEVVISPIKSQGGWLSAFEAIVSGCTLVVSPEMTASSIIEEHQLGIVTDDYEDEIYKIYISPRSNIVGPRWVIDNLSWDKYCGEMLQVFKEVKE